MKEAYYFSHDSNATRDPKIIKLLSKYKWSGYGMFWAIVEMLYEQNGKIHFEDNIDVFAYSLNLSPDETKDLITFLINIELLSIDEDGFLFSKRLMKSIEKVTELKEKKHLAGIKSAEARKQKTGNSSEQDSDSVEEQTELPSRSVEDLPDFSSTEHEQYLNGSSTDVEHLLSIASTDFNKGKEKKGKEIKEKEILSSSPPKSEISEEGREYANFFRGLLPPTQKVTESDLKNWGDTFDKLVRIDKRPGDEIYQITDWARKDSFWGEQGNFLSACKLRNKSKDGVLYYDMFLQKLNRERSKSNGTANGHQVQRPAWITAKE